MLNCLVPDHVLFYRETHGKVEVVGDVFNSFVVGGELDVNPLLFFPDTVCETSETPLIKNKAVVRGLEIAKV